MFGKKAKRLLLCGSLYGKMVDPKDIKALENLNLINDTLDLAYDPRAIEFPATISGFLARRFNIDKKTLLDTVTNGNKEDIKNMILHICEKAPSYMRYDVNDMYKDISTLLSLKFTKPQIV